MPSYSTSDLTNNMQQINLENLQENFEQVFKRVVRSGEPVNIVTEAGNAILVYEEIWNGVIETLNLFSIPRIREAVRSSLRFLQTVRPHFEILCARQWG